jgi:hypothetical protein
MTHIPNSPYTDVRSFAALSQALEGVGTSAYLGAASLITDKNVLTAAGSILTTEARHDAWVAAAVNKGAAWNTPYDTPLSLSGVFSLASECICSYMIPMSNLTYTSSAIHYVVPDWLPVSAGDYLPRVEAVHCDSQGRNQHRRHL